MSTGKLLIFLLISLILNACAIQKRQYRKGFYLGHTVRLKANHKYVKESKVKTETASGSLPTITSLNTQKDSPALLASASKQYAFQPVAEVSISPNHPCDTLILHDGSSIHVLLKEVGYKDIRYKRCDFQDGPDYLVEKFRVKAIHYNNGVKEIVSPNAPPAGSGNYGHQSPKAPAKEQNLNAGLSLAFSILGIYPLFGIGSILAIIFGLIAQHQMNLEPNRYGNANHARWGIILGIAGLFLFGLLIFAFL